MHRATAYLAPNLTAKLTLKAYGKSRRPRKNARTLDVVLTVGRPNYRERKFIADCKKAGEALPLRKVLLKHFPKR